jgi:hypothetical protein
VLAAKRILTAFATARQSPRQLILETDPALLQGRSLGALGMTYPL